MGIKKLSLTVRRSYMVNYQNFANLNDGTLPSDGTFKGKELSIYSSSYQNVFLPCLVSNSYHPDIQ